MSSKTPPQSRLEELEEKRARLKRQLRVARMAIPRAEWAKNEDVQELHRKIKCLNSCVHGLCSRLKDPETHRVKKRMLYARDKINVLSKQKVRYERDKEAILARQRIYAKRRQAERNADPYVIAERAAKKAVMREKRKIWMRQRLDAMLAKRKDVNTAHMLDTYGRTFIGNRSAYNHARHQIYYSNIENRSKRQAYGREYRKRPEVRAKLREKERMLRIKDPQYALRQSLRCRIRSALKANGTYKKDKTEALLGCSIDCFKQYIESKFLSGMTWEQRSAWHIDHIRPCASFDLTEERQRLECFNYTNMRPLWKLDNLRKGSKIMAGRLNIDGTPATHQ